MIATTEGDTRSRWRAVPGILVLAYVVGTVADLSLLNADPTRFNAFHRSLNGLGARIVLAVVFAAIVIHAVDGSRRAIEALFPATRGHDVGWRAGVRCVTAATLIPGVLAVLWPALRTGWPL